MTQTDAPSDSHAPARLPAYVVVMLGVVMTLGALFLMHEFNGVVAPVFMALNLVIAAYPIHRWLVGKGTPPWLAACVMAVAVIVILLAAVAALVWSVSSLVSELPKYSTQYLDIYHNAAAFLGRFNININNIGFSDVFNVINPSTITGAITTLLSSASSILGVIAVILASLIFLAMDAPSMHRRVRIATVVQPHLGQALDDFTTNVRKYWIVTTVFGLIIAILDGVTLWILGVPLPLVWAVLSFITNYIPTVGFFIGLAPPALLALFVSGWKIALVVVIVYCVLNFVVQTIIQPRVAGESVGLSVTVSFVSLLLWGFVLGPLGTLLALPMTLLLKALLVDADPKARWVKALIDADPGDALKSDESAA
ncbi:MAG: AI-2E family transporter [Propionibacteriaceae bacterium]|nr:AI-2E family transporter [Propionibacteriaceae bacterium]